MTHLDQILATIKDRYTCPDIHFLCDRLAGGHMEARKQLADKVATKALLPPLMQLEVSKWGVTDDLSQVPDIRRLAK